MACSVVLVVVSFKVNPMVGMAATALSMGKLSPDILRMADALTTDPRCNCQFGLANDAIMNKYQEELRRALVGETNLLKGTYPEFISCPVSGFEFPEASLGMVFVLFGRRRGGPVCELQGRGLLIKMRHLFCKLASTNEFSPQDPP